MMFMIRKPVVAEAFYPSNKQALEKMVADFLNCIPKKQGKITIAPHAGYIYSGACAGRSFASLKRIIEKTDSTVVLIGPNHTGLGMPIAVSKNDWETPLGIVKCDLELADELIKSNQYIAHDEIAHLREHSLEVMLPFIQVMNKSAKIVCICMGAQDINAARIIAQAVANCISKRQNTCVVCSSDFTHYESAEHAKKIDSQAIEKILALKAEEFNVSVEQNNLSICGYGPITAGILIARALKLDSPTLNHYTNSGHASGDFESVVAYASITF